MTEEEAREALFKLHKEYMRHTKKERLSLYEEYRKNRLEIIRKLESNVNLKKLSELKVICN